MDQFWAVGSVTVIALSGVVAANLSSDLGVAIPLSRRVAGVLGGVAYLIAVLWLDAWTATALSGILSLLILALRLGFRRGLRGVRGSVSAQKWAEVTYPVAGSLSLAIGWGLLGDRWLAFVPIAFMALGDTAAGLVRATLGSHKFTTIWSSVAMFGACLVAAGLFHPYWIGLIGAITATAAEGFRPKALGALDDNLPIVGMSLAVMSLLARATL